MPNIAKALEKAGKSPAYAKIAIAFQGDVLCEVDITTEDNVASYSLLQMGRSPLSNLAECELEHCLAQIMIDALPWQVKGALEVRYKSDDVPNMCNQ